MSIGENIKKYRKIRGLTQSELAHLIGKSEISVRKYEAKGVPITLNQSAISQYENGLITPSFSGVAVGRYETGQREPQLSVIEAIAQALEVTVPELLGYTHPDAEPNTAEYTLENWSTRELLEELLRRDKDALDHTQKT